MDERLDESISSDGSRSLDSHLVSCAACRQDWQMLVAIDRILTEESLDRAPVGFEQSVARQIAGRLESRRRIESVGIPAACSIAAIGVGYGVHRLVNWEAARSFVRGISESASGTLAPLAEPVSEAPVLMTAWSENPAILGATLALAVAATVFLGISAIRYVRQFTLEYR